MYGEGGYKGGYGDIETGGGGEPSLYPGLPQEEAVFRWAFIQKVYGILSIQVVLSALVASVVVFTPSIQTFILQTPGILIVVAICPLILLCALGAYRQSHPTNLILLGLFTVFMSLTIGLACAFSPGDVVIQALLLTSVVVISLTVYTYWAVRQGYDFSFLGPMLFAAVIILILWSFIQIFFPSSHTGRAIFSLIGSLIFSLYIIYDTDNLIKRYSYDEYVWASVALYLDIVNLFINLLNLLRELQGGDR